MKIGVLTGGGDCCGLNQAIRAAVMRAMDFNHEMVGLREGWKGLVEGLTFPLGLDDVEGLIDKGGTLLESSRTNPFKKEEDLRASLENFKRLGLDCVLALGGDDTLGVASRLFKEYQVPTVGVPKTMDNDLSETDYTFGFDSAVAVAVDAADRLKDTARSHRRYVVLEVMGRHAGWVALWTAVASGADWLFIPEVPGDLQTMAAQLKKKLARGKHWGLVVASEGTHFEALNAADETKEKALDAFGHEILRERGIGPFLAEEVEKRMEVETRFAVLGHIVRGGSPTPFDRILASRLGIKAVELISEGRFGHMASLKGNEITAVPLEAAVGKTKTVPLALYEEILPLFDK
ncbi:MAG: ATP-dependent 6-phosphofructokinase [Armatimonadetes bacterium]|nr:ATP-dependent 6-phosphofructokinase [Armatimonadota bacterium]NIM24797.1 ATP-dependent 6-phosphofructokinase [Armatimonadota bacterium]NIM68688.1 ATP-dependent 6-phosphofructokinase [Armatimonadota bacterium]NIM76983.1 ATP-dependent 6-phosphofructokinase [Armatimonadota bacterium]NIN06889.1 ATP-dependent 6-phosphofructokinase [Armatimonadota bacterium]